MSRSEATTHRAGDATTTLETVEKGFGIGYSQGAGASTGDWMKPPGDLFLYCDMKDLGADMVSLFALVCGESRDKSSLASSSLTRDDDRDYSIVARRNRARVPRRVATRCSVRRRPAWFILA